MRNGEVFAKFVFKVLKYVVDFVDQFFSEFEKNTSLQLAQLRTFC